MHLKICSALVAHLLKNCTSHATLLSRAQSRNLYVLLCSISTNTSVSQVALRRYFCSKKQNKCFFLWFFPHLFVSLPSLTTNQRCIGHQSSMKCEATNRNNPHVLSYDGVSPRSGELLSNFCVSELTTTVKMRIHSFAEV